MFKGILRSSEYEIIKFLALNGPSNRYEISKGTEIKYQTVYSAVKRLLQKRLFIDIFDVKKARTDLDKPSYFATFIGKLAAMAISEDDDVVDLIATSEPRQTFILEEWEFICQSDLTRSYVLSIIRTKFLTHLQSLDFKKMFKMQNRETTVNFFRLYLTRNILWDGYLHFGVTRPQYSDVLQIFMDNPRIREIMEYLLLDLEEEAIRLNDEICKVRKKYGLKMSEKKEASLLRARG